MKSIIGKLFLALLLFFSLPISSLSKEKIILAADYWCPYSCSPTSPNPGYMVEMAKNIFAKYNIEVEYIIMPWVQAVEEVRKGNIHGIIGASYNEAEDFIYPNIPQAYGITNAYTIALGDNLKYNKYPLAHKKLGLVLNYKYPKEIANHIMLNLPKNPELFHFAASDYPLQEQLKNLTNKEIDILFENVFVMTRHIEENNLRNIQDLGHVTSELDDLYIAFSPKFKRSERYAKILSEGMEALRNSGTLAVLHRKYHMNI